MSQKSWEYHSHFEILSKLLKNINESWCFLVPHRGRQYYGGITYYVLRQGNRRTLIVVDGVQVPNMPPLGFNELVLAPVWAVRDYLNKLKSGK